MKKYILLAFIALISCSNDLYSQQLWNKSYAFNYFNSCSEIIQTSDGGFLRTGDETPSGHRVPFLVKLNSTGNAQWSYLYDNGFDCQSFYLFETSDKGFIFFGNNYDGNNKLLVTRVDSIGNVLWSNNFFSQRIEYCMRATKTSDNGYVITSWMVVNHIWQGLVIKIDSAGNYLWSERAKSDQGVIPFKTIETLNGTYLLIGAVGSWFSPVCPYIMKLKENGKIEQAKCFPNIVGGQFTEIIQTSDSGFILSGVKNYSQSNSSGFLMKIDKNLNILWMKEMVSCQSAKLVESANHEIYFHTYSYMSSTLSKLDSTFSFLWSKTTNSFSLSKISNNDFLFSNNGFQVNGILKTDLAHLNTCGIHDTILSFTSFLPTDSNIIVSHNHKIQQIISPVIIRIPINVTENTECIIAHVNEIENNDEVGIYPNPFQYELTIKANNSILSEITLYDLTSRQLLQQTFTTTTTINTSHLAEGIYIYEVRDNKGVIKKGKLVKE